MRIIIDGYNLLKALPEWRHHHTIDLQGAREQLIADLGRYSWRRGHHVTVVFDGGLGGHPIRQRANARGVQVIYSPRGESADAVIRQMAPQVAHRGVVVTSDRALAADVQHMGAEVIGSGEFAKRLRQTLLGGAKRADQGDEAATATPIQPKKGQSRRSRRQARERERKLRNL